MAGLRLERLSKSYGEVVAVADLSLDINEGELVVLLGPSGCGKTTTLRMVAGFVEASEGRIVLGGRDITDLPPYRRNCGLVFQNYALFPHLSVFENVAFGLRMRRLPEADIKRRVAEALALVRLDALAERMPRQLSGGQQQRVALARALVIQPDILLLDEPLSNLDAKLRQEVRLEIRALQRKLGLTTMLVTHDQEEALSLADRLVVMEHGAIQQVGTQRELYERPANRFVAGFVGRTNFIDGAVVAAGRFRSRGGVEIRVNGGTGEVLALRPRGVDVVWDVGNEPPRKTKLLAERRLPRGMSDIQCFSGPASFEMNQAGALEPMDYSSCAGRRGLHPSTRSSRKVLCAPFRNWRRTVTPPGLQPICTTTVDPQEIPPLARCPVRGGPRLLFSITLTIAVLPVIRSTTTAEQP